MYVSGRVYTGCSVEKMNTCVPFWKAAVWKTDKVIEE